MLDLNGADALMRARSFLSRQLAEMQTGLFCSRAERVNRGSLIVLRSPFIIFE